MRRLVLTLPAPAENLALDEALLEWAEEHDPQAEFLRLWESPRPMVVVGRSTRVHEEVCEAACADRGIPILRRASGGASIVAGPGCLMYAVVLSFQLRPDLRDIRRAHCFVLSRLANSLRGLGLPVQHAGTSDLVVEEEMAEIHGLRQRQKFSGNSLRIKRTHMVYHGTLLYDFDLSLIATCLRMPPRQPEYRAARSHREFVTNLPVDRTVLVNAVCAAWPTRADLVDWPRARVEQLVAERFSRDAWNYEFGE